VSDDDQLRKRLRDYLDARRDFQIRMNKKRGLTAEIVWARWQEALGPHLSSDHEEGMPSIATPPDADWNRTSVESIKVREDKAIVRTLEQVGASIGPERFEYVMVQEGGEWRIRSRRWFDTFSKRWRSGFL
jgi:hypothetical protein